MDESDGRLGDNAPWTASLLTSHPAYLQYRLNLLGYDAGPMDGTPGQRTREALAAFQREQCLADTGEQDRATLEKLAQADGFKAPCAGNAKQELPTMQADIVALSDGSTLVGEIADGKVPFKSSFGEIEVSLANVHGFSGGKLRLADETVLNGAFGKGEIKLATSMGTLNVASEEIVSIERGRNNPGNGSNGNPAEPFIVESAKSELKRELIKKKQDTIFELVSIRKENGRIISDKNAYLADIVINLKLKVCGFFHSAETDWDMKMLLVFKEMEKCPAPPGKVVKAGAKASYTYDTRSIYGINSVVPVKGEALFYKKEKGWSLEAVTIKRDQ